MINRKNHNIWNKTIAMGVVCLFLVNTAFQEACYAISLGSALARNLELQGPQAATVRRLGVIVAILDPLLDRVEATLGEENVEAEKIIAAKTILKDHCLGTISNASERLAELQLGIGVETENAWVEEATRLAKRVKGIAILNAGAKIGWHRGAESVHENIIISLQRNLAHFERNLTRRPETHPRIAIDDLDERRPEFEDRLTRFRSSAERFNEWFYGSRQEGEDVPDDLMFDIDTLCDSPVTYIDGRQFHIVSIPVPNFGISPDGREVKAHLGLRRGIIWMATGFGEDADTDEILDELEINFGHEIEEFDLVTDADFLRQSFKRMHLGDPEEFITGGQGNEAVDVDRMAQWRDEASPNAQRFFHLLHREASRLVLEDYEGRLKRVDKAVKKYQARLRRINKKIESVADASELDYEKETIERNIESEKREKINYRRLVMQARAAYEDAQMPRRVYGGVTGGIAQTAKRKAAPKEKKRASAKNEALSKEELRRRGYVEIARNNKGYVLAQKLPNPETTTKEVAVSLFRPNGNMAVLDLNASGGYGFDDDFFVAFDGGENLAAWKLRKGTGAIVSLDMPALNTAGTRFTYSPGCVSLCNRDINGSLVRADREASRNLAIVDLNTCEFVASSKGLYDHFPLVYSFEAGQTRFALGQKEGVYLYPFRAKMDEETGLPEPINKQPISCTRLAFADDSLVTCDNEGILTVRDPDANIIEENIDASGGFQVQGSLVIVRDKNNKLSILDVAGKQGQRVVLEGVDAKEKYEVKERCVFATGNKKQLTLIDLSRKPDEMVVEHGVKHIKDYDAQGSLTVLREQSGITAVLDLDRVKDERIIEGIDATNGHLLWHGYFVAVDELNTPYVWELGDLAKAPEDVTVSKKGDKKRMALAKHLRRKDVGQAEKGALIGVHRKMEGLNDQVRECFAEHIGWFIEQGYVTPPADIDGEELRQGIIDGTIEVTINKDAFPDELKRTAPNGEIIVTMPLPVDHLAIVYDEDGNEFEVDGHIGLTRGLAWQAVGEGNQDEEVAEWTEDRQLAKMHEEEEYEVASDFSFVTRWVQEYADDSARLLDILIFEDDEFIRVDMEKMAAWRDQAEGENIGEFEAAVKFFKHVHKEAWRRTKERCLDESTDLFDEYEEERNVPVPQFVAYRRADLNRMARRARDYEDASIVPEVVVVSDDVPHDIGMTTSDDSASGATVHFTVNINQDGQEEHSLLRYIELSGEVAEAVHLPEMIRNEVRNRRDGVCRLLAAYIKRYETGEDYADEAIDILKEPGPVSDENIASLTRRLREDFPSLGINVMHLQQLQVMAIQAVHYDHNRDDKVGFPRMCSIAGQLVQNFSSLAQENAGLYNIRDMQDALANARFNERHPLSDDESREVFIIESEHLFNFLNGISEEAQTICLRFLCASITGNPEYLIGELDEERARYVTGVVSNVGIDLAEMSHMVEDVLEGVGLPAGNPIRAQIVAHNQIVIANLRALAMVDPSYDGQMEHLGNFSFPGDNEIIDLLEVDGVIRPDWLTTDAKFTIGEIRLLLVLASDDTNLINMQSSEIPRILDSNVVSGIFSYADAMIDPDLARNALISLRSMINVSLKSTAMEDEAYSLSHVMRVNKYLTDRMNRHYETTCSLLRKMSLFKGDEAIRENTESTIEKLDESMSENVIQTSSGNVMNIVMPVDFSEGDANTIKLGEITLHFYTGGEKVTFHRVSDTGDSEVIGVIQDEKICSSLNTCASLIAREFPTSMSIHLSTGAAGYNFWDIGVSEATQTLCRIVTFPEAGSRPERKTTQLCENTVNIVTGGGTPLEGKDGTFRDTKQVTDMAKLAITAIRLDLDENLHPVDAWPKEEETLAFLETLGDTGKLIQSRTLTSQVEALEFIEKISTMHLDPSHKLTEKIDGKRKIIIADKLIPKKYLQQLRKIIEETEGIDIEILPFEEAEQKATGDDILIIDQGLAGSLDEDCPAQRIVLNNYDTERNGFACLDAAVAMARAAFREDVEFMSQMYEFLTGAHLKDPDRTREILKRRELNLKIMLPDIVGPDINYDMLQEKAFQLFLKSA